MAREKKQYPTDKELEILQVLWTGGPATVRQINDAINRKTETGYTTTLKLMQIMTEKNLLKRDDTSFRHIFEAAVSEEVAEKQVMGDILDRVFAGSTEKLVMRALSSKKVSSEELNNIRKMLDQMEES